MGPKRLAGYFFSYKRKLDKAFPNNPVVLTRIDGHAVVVNSKALELADINSTTTVNGGEVILEDGEPSGILVDNAIEIVRSFIPEFSEEENSSFVISSKDCFAVGLTTITDAGLDKQDILLIDKLHKNGKLTIKVYAMLSPTDENFEYFLKMIQLEMVDLLLVR